MKFIDRVSELLRPYRTFQPWAWAKSTHRMARLIRPYCTASPNHVRAIDPDGFGILVTPWLGTTVPWYSIVTGVMLANRGISISFVIDDLPFGCNPIRSFYIRRCIARVAALLVRRYRVVFLSDYTRDPAPITAAQAARIEALAALNAIHHLRGEMSADGRAEYEHLVIRQLRNACPAIFRLVADVPFGAFFMPGGIYGTTGVWLDACRAAGRRVASYDAGGYGLLMLATDGIAAQLQDIPRAFKLFEQLPLSERREAVLTAQAELGKRRAGNDKFTSQMTGSNESGGATRVAILLALNSSWDQAALGLHAVFANNTAWIVETVRWALDCTPHEIIVRQHPAERLENGRTSDDYRALLTREFGTHPRLRFVAAGDPVNTYDLLRSAAVVVAYTSTFGVEASALGNVVIVPSRCYYADLGFVWKADSRTLYFSLIEQAMGGELTVTQAMKDKALWCYYLAQVRNWIFSPFNPEGYNDWSKLTIEEIEKEPAVQVYLPSLIDNIPAAYTNHTIGAH